MRINKNTRRSARPVFRSVNSSRRRAMNRRTLNSGRNYGTYCTFRIIDFPSFEIDVDKDAAIDYMNTHTFVDIPVVVDDIYEDHNTYRVHLTYDMDEETGFNAWVGKQNAESPIMDVDETTIYSLIYSVLKNWARIKFDKQYGNDVSSARRRNDRRAVNCRRVLNSGRQRLNSAAEIGDIVDFTELNEAQQNYVVQNWYKWRELDWIREFFDENIMENYHYDVEQLAKECTEKLFNDFGVQLDINTDKIYWQSNSQGPYPEWKLSEIFDDCTVAVMGGVGDESEFVDITFANNSSYDVDKSVYFDINHIVETDPEFEYEMEYEVEPDMLAHYGLAPETTEAVHAVVNTAQYFIDTVWKYINEVCTDFPDDSYIKEELEYGVETGFQKFEVLDETTAVPEREVPDDFNTYY